MELEIKLEKKVINLINTLTYAGAKCYLVGGKVRDSILHLTNNDIDIEVYNLSMNEIIELLDPEYELIVYLKYGVIKIPQLKVDISLPKQEVCINNNYYQVSYKINPHLDITKAALRRDLSINSIYYDIDNQQIIDPYHGIDDLIDKKCHLINPHFFNDPTRIIRLLYYILKYDLHVDNKLCDLINSYDYSLINHNKLKTYLNKIVLINNYQNKINQKHLFIINQLIDEIKNKK